MMTSEKNLLASRQRHTTPYLRTAGAAAEIVRYAESRIELNRQKKLPTYEDQTRTPNSWTMRSSACLPTAILGERPPLAARKLGWSQQPDLIRTPLQPADRKRFMGNT